MTGQTKFNGHEWPHLGPVTEARFADVFGKGATATAVAAAGLLGIDPETLTAMTDQGIVRAVRKGKLRSWTEADLRNYLMMADAPKRRREPDPPTTGSTGVGKVVPFSKRKSARR